METSFLLNCQDSNKDWFEVIETFFNTWQTVSFGFWVHLIKAKDWIINMRGKQSQLSHYIYWLSEQGNLPEMLTTWIQDSKLLQALRKVHLTLRWKLTLEKKYSGMEFCIFPGMLSLKNNPNGSSKQ